ncbi:DinB family protein [Bacillus wiedmannii]|uniref:Squalene--hopene cyclase n=1 Tax=Bacillus wiedmannii TaxID=1890302 RepID=A0ABX5E370_9BACI|nr:DinB family protein [Bacillus wiedmannii]PRT43401.1 squalene--hopene cyclase [Bacillus wiedmannii]
MKLQNLTRREIITSLQTTLKNLDELVQGMPEQVLFKARLVGGWNTSEIIGHLYDTEEVWGKRIKDTFSQNVPILESYNPEEYVLVRNYKEYKREEILCLISRFKVLREKTISLLDELDNWDKVAMHKEEGKISIKYMAEVLALHEQHHLNQIEELAIITKEGNVK